MTASDAGLAAEGARPGDGVLPVTHSLLAAAGLVRMLESRYDVGEIARCVLYRSYANDVYRIETTAGRTFYLKVYRGDWRTPEDVAWELRVHDHLLRNGVAVARPVPGRDGADLTILHAPEGPRVAVLFAEAPGSKPRRPFTADLYRRFGGAAGRMHAALDTFPDPSGRAPDDFEMLVRSPGRILREWWERSPDDLELIDRIVERIGGSLRQCGPALDWGVCHGDLSLDNVTVTGDGSITFYDFDLAALSWRARDPCGAYAYSRFDPEARPFWAALLIGYRRERTFGDADERAVPLMYAVNQLWDLGHEIRRWRIWSGEWRVTPDTVGPRLREIERWLDAELA